MNDLVPPVGPPTSSGVPIGRASRPGEPLARLPTPLSALVAALQDVGGPENETLVVATLVHLLRSGRLTVLGKASTRRRKRP